MAPAHARAAARRAAGERARDGEHPVLALVQSDMITLILELTGVSPNVLFVTKLVARARRPAALVVRRLFWQDRIVKGTAFLKGHANGDICAFSPDGQHVVTWRHGPKGYRFRARVITARWGLVRLWDATTGASGALQNMLRDRTSIVQSCAFSPDCERIATASRDGKAQLWDAETGALQATLEKQNDEVRSCAFSPDSNRVVTGSINGTASWDNTARL
jgi:hypothetical protein